LDNVVLLGNFTMKRRRQVFFYGNHFRDFYADLDVDARKKIDWVIGLVCVLEVVPSKFFKHVKDTVGLYEIRVSVRRCIYRIFCFFDKGNLVIVLNGFQKKTKKTPRREIVTAERIKKGYYEQKR
jgi:phage-related protein